METKKYNEFNRIEYLKNFITKFLQSNSKVRNEIEGTLALLDRAPNTFDNIEKKKIIKRLDMLLSNPNFLELVQKEKEEREIPELSDTTGTQRIDTLRKITELAQTLTYRLSESIFSDCERHYNMSKLASKKMISDIQNPDGSTKKDVNYFDDYEPAKSITDFSGNTISIQPIGRIEYSCNPSLDDYIYAYKISKHLDNEIIMEPQTLFSIIHMGRLDDPDYKNAVANTLLSDNNIELSHTCGFVGELAIIKNSSLSDGEEKFDSGFYNYKIPGSKYTLIYEDAKIEAAKAYSEEQEKKIKLKESNDDER